eukprot:m.95581 g.95581  ORF g.95581 m.95581 type:complete len:96 (+) comp21929_c0_seq7:478-765(+)
MAERYKKRTLSICFEVMDRLFPLVPSLLSPRPNAAFYLVIIEQNKRSEQPDDIFKAIPGFTADTVLSRKAGREHLSILKYQRKPDNKADRPNSDR